MSGILGHRGLLLRPTGGGGPTEFNSYVSALAPVYWWRCDETSGTTLASNGSQASAGLTTSNSPTLNVAAPVGFPGIAAGVTFNGTNQSAIGANQSLPNNVSGNFTYLMFVRIDNTSQTNTYAYGKGNRGDLIYGFVSQTMEFFTNSYTGPDNPRTGSGITISDTNPHMIVYRRNGTSWQGFKDNVSQFSVTADFALGWINSQNSALGCASAGSNFCAETVWDMQVYDKALSDSELTNIWNKAQGL